MLAEAPVFAEPQCFTERLSLSFDVATLTHSRGEESKIWTPPTDSLMAWL